LKSPKAEAKNEQVGTVRKIIEARAALKAVKVPSKKGILKNS